MRINIVNADIMMTTGNLGRFGVSYLSTGRLWLKLLRRRAEEVLGAAPSSTGVLNVRVGQYKRLIDRLLIAGGQSIRGLKRRKVVRIIVRDCKPECHISK